MTPKKAESIRRQRIAELTSGIGALVLGIGLGAMLADRLARLGLWALVIGALAHGWGMYDRHRIEQSSQIADPWWASLLYWSCWVLLAIGALVFLARFLGSG